MVVVHNLRKRAWEDIEPLNSQQLSWIILRLDQNASEVRKLLTVKSRGSIVPLAEFEENEFVQLLPISTEKDLEEMERKLEKDQTYRSKLTNELRLVGGKTFDEMVFKVMDHLLSIRIANQFTYLGHQKNCRAFQDLRICNSVKASIRSRLPDASNEQFSKRVGRWLTEAKDPRKKKKKVARDEVEL